MAKGGFWNRAGRRSGGYQPAVFHVARLKKEEQFYQCPECSNDQLPLFVTSGCLSCQKIVELHRQEMLPGQKNHKPPEKVEESG